MRDRKPVTQTMSASETRQHFSEVVNRVYRGEERVVIERSGIPVAAVISARDLERLKTYEERLAEEFRALDQIAEAFKDVSPEEIEHETAKALAEVQAEMRAEPTHPEDDLVLATAVSASVDVLVSGDRQLLKLGSYEGVRIRSPRDFIAYLDAQADPPTPAPQP